MTSSASSALSGAVLYVTDVDRAAAFYVGVVGFVPRKATDDHVMLESPGFEFVLHRIQAHIAAPYPVQAPT